MSTTEAEYMASGDAGRESVWLRQLLKDLGYYPTDEPVPIYNDNTGCIHLSKNPVDHDRSKHIALRHHWLRENVQAGTIELSHIASEDNQADLLTKSLPPATFQHLRVELGVKPRG
jgi:hypothetical protein